MVINTVDLNTKTGTVAYAQFVYNGSVANEKIGQKISTMCFIKDGKIFINATGETVPQKDIISWKEI